MGKILFKTSDEYKLLKAAADNYDAVVQAVLAASDGITAEEVTPDVISEMLAASPASDQDALTKAGEKIKALEDSLAAIATMLDSLDPSVKGKEKMEDKVSAIKTKLAQRPAAAPASPQGDASTTDLGDGDGVDWDAIDKLPHNVAADKEII